MRALESVIERRESVEGVKERSESTRERVIGFVKEYYREHGVAPSTRIILESCETYWSQLYKAFPGRYSEICEVAGVPVPEKRMSQVAKATAARRERAAPDHDKLPIEIQADEAEAALEVERKRKAALERKREADAKRLELEAMEDPEKVLPYLKTLDPEIVAPFFRLCTDLKLDQEKAWKEAVETLGETWDEWGRAIRADGEEPYFKDYVADVIEAFMPKKRLELALGHHRGKTYSCTCDKCGLSYEYEDKESGFVFTCPNGCIQRHGTVESVYPCPVCKELGRVVRLSYDRSRNVLFCKTCGLEGEVRGESLNLVGTKAGVFKHQIAELEEKVKGLQGKLSETQRQINAGAKEKQALEREIRDKQQTCTNLNKTIATLSAESEKNRQGCVAELRRAEAMEKKNNDIDEKIKILNSVALFIMEPERADMDQLHDFITQVGTAIELRKRPGHVGEAVKMAVEARDHLLKMVAGSRYILREEADKRLEEQLARQRGEYEGQLKAKDGQIAGERRLREMVEREQKAQASQRDEDKDKLRRENRQLRDKIRKLEQDLVDKGHREQLQKLS